MTERQMATEPELGQREPAACEPASFAQFLRRARMLGFTDAEIDRLRATYGASKLGTGNEHRLGGARD
ncbi:hypothetical protein DEM25_001730 [Oceaniradius stylonematis]|uniref:Uncharacterized protein n=2 Tax=Oceaniradius stylonematis TaxID=2184161 RepID=A0A3A8ACP2_9HYPH|nr:hypothetical protein DEM25_001730 [Oceaniradius stylonematis]